MGVEQEKSERLLLNVLPKEIASLLKDKDQTIADHLDEVTVLFADVVGFTPLSEKLSPRGTYERIKDQLNCVLRGTMKIKGKGEMETWFLESA